MLERSTVCLTFHELKRLFSLLNQIYHLETLVFRPALLCLARLLVLCQFVRQTLQSLRIFTCEWKLLDLVLTTRMLLEVLCACDARSQARPL